MTSRMVAVGRWKGVAWRACEAAHTAVSMSACLPACPCLRVCVNVPVSLYVRLSACQVTAEGRWQLAKRGNRGIIVLDIRVLLIVLYVSVM